MGASCWEETAASELSAVGAASPVLCFPQGPRVGASRLAQHGPVWFSTPSGQDLPRSPRTGSLRASSPQTPRTGSPLFPLRQSPLSLSGLDLLIQRLPFVQSPFRSPSTGSPPSPPGLDPLTCSFRTDSPQPPPTTGSLGLDPLRTLWDKLPSAPPNTGPHDWIPSSPSGQAPFSPSSAGTAGGEPGCSSLLSPVPPCLLRAAARLPPRPAPLSPLSPPAVIQAELTAAPHDTLARHVSPAIA